ncbi:MAG TPA: vitamin K epoxide reductase family protein [Terriglobales bacterium]|nr:vitamin K epoxide reductase family protein [Terriglobales bacterium]
MSEFSRRLMSLVGILAVCGVVVSSVSLQHHFATSKTAYCDLGAMLNCDIVNRSQYSSILGIPVALIGMLGYAALAGLATVYRDRPQARTLLFVGSAAGLAFALYLTYVESRILGVYCILCLTSLALIATITMMSGVLWWKREER